MTKRTYRRFTAEEKMTVLKEAEHPGVSVAEVCRKHGIAPSLLYNWRAVAQDAAGSALKRTDRRGQSKPDAEVARMLGELTRVSGATKAEILRVVEVTQQRSPWRLDAIRAALGVPRSLYFEWRSRAKLQRLDDIAPVAPRRDALLAEEEQAIRLFALESRLRAMRPVAHETRPRRSLPQSRAATKTRGACWRWPTGARCGH